MNILCVLYPDPESGYPSLFLRDGKLLGSLTGEFDLNGLVTEKGHRFIPTSERTGKDYEMLIKQADVVITQPNWPADLSAEIINSASNLKLIISAGDEWDTIDVEAAQARGIKVAAVKGASTGSTAEHIVMTALVLVRNFADSYKSVLVGRWNIADSVKESYDIEGMKIGAIGGEPSGIKALKSLKALGADVSYSSENRVGDDEGITHFSNYNDMISSMDVVILNCQRTQATEGMVNADFIASMKQGSFIVNTEHGKLVDRLAVVSGLVNNKLAGYGGDAWDEVPPAIDHHWRNMPNHAMTPDMSGASIPAQARVSSALKTVLTTWFETQSVPQENTVA